MPRVLLFSAVVIWGWTFVATKVLVAELGPVEIFGLRLLIGLPVLVAVLAVQRIPLRLTRADARPLLWGGGVFTLHFLIQIAGIDGTTASNTGWIISVSPLALAVLSALFLGERIGRSGVAGIAIATAGILLLVSRGRFGDLGWLESQGDWLVLVSAFTWALYTVSTRDLVRRHHPLAVTVAVLSIATVLTAVLFLAALLLGGADLGRIRALSPRGVAALLYLAIPGMALGQWFWQEGVAKLGAARAGLYLYLEPLATLALAVPLLGEPFGPFLALGGALVLAGVYVGQRERRAGGPASEAGGEVPSPKKPACQGDRVDESRASVSLRARGAAGSEASWHLPGRGGRPAVDEQVVRPEVTRDEVVGGVRVVASPAQPPHATQHVQLDYVLRAHASPGYRAASDLLTRHDEESDFATDTCLFRDGVDPATGDRFLEEIAFEVVSEQSQRLVEEKARRMHRRGVRRFFAVWVKGQRVCEWSAESNGWRELDGNARIEDPCLVVPLAVAALLDAAAADNAVVEALAAKGNEAIGQREEAAEVRGKAAALAEGILKLLASRAVSVSAAQCEEILACRDLDRLERWLLRAAVVTAADDVAVEP